jgi:hypothetical protein
MNTVRMAAIMFACLAGTHTLLGCETLNTTDQYAHCRPIKDLVEQHRCLMTAAIQSDDSARIRELVKTGYISINGPREVGHQTYLSYAAAQTLGRKPVDSEVFHALLDVGADPNQLPYALTKILNSDKFRTNQPNLRETIEWFLQYGQDTDAVIAEGPTYGEMNLLGYVSHDCVRDLSVNPLRHWLVQELIRRKADANWMNAEGVSVLHQLSGVPGNVGAKHCGAIMKVLVAAGADMAARTADNLTPIDYTLVGLRVSDARGDRHTCTTVPSKFYSGWQREAQSQLTIRQILQGLGSPAPTIQGDKFACPELLSWW